MYIELSVARSILVRPAYISTWKGCKVYIYTYFPSLSILAHILSHFIGTYCECLHQDMQNATLVILYNTRFLISFTHKVQAASGFSSESKLTACSSLVCTCCCLVLHWLKLG